MFSNIHHIAIIGTNYQKTREFYVEKLGFKVISEYNRINKNIEQKRLRICYQKNNLNFYVFC